MFQGCVGDGIIGKGTHMIGEGVESADDVLVCVLDVVLEPTVFLSIIQVEEVDKMKANDAARVLYSANGVVRG